MSKSQSSLFVGTLVVLLLSQNSALAEAKAKDSSITYPEGALQSAYEEEVAQIKRTEELERRATRINDSIEAKKNQIEQQISAKRFKIEKLKLKDEQIGSEMKASSTDLEDLQKDLSSVEQEYFLFKQKADDQVAFSESAKKNLEQANKQLAESRERMQSARDSISKMLYSNKNEIQKMRAESSVMEAKIDSLESQAADLESQEAQSRLEIATLKKQIMDKNDEIKNQSNALAEAKRKADSAQMDLRVAKAEFDKVEKSKNETEKRVLAEKSKYEELIFAALRSKSVLETERIRIDAELEKIKSYAEGFKRAQASAQEELSTEQNRNMEAKLVLQTVKATLMQDLVQFERDGYKKDKQVAQSRKLASVSETAEIADGSRSWVVNKSCSLFSRASSKSDRVPASEVQVGQKIFGQDYSEHWIRVKGGTNATGFIRKDCGHFE